MAEENMNYYNDLFCDDSGILFTREYCTIPECYRSDTRLHALDTLDGLDKENIY
jgi:hypothetical protein